MQTIILAGWSGTRLRPVSTSQTPKQFMTLKDNKSLLQTTYERLFAVTGNHKHIWISSNDKYHDQIIQQLKIYQNDQIIIEPSKQNTAPAFGCVLAYLLYKQSISPEETVLFCPADHLIHPTERFTNYIHQAQTLANSGKIVLFGIQPDRPETGYGYIHCTHISGEQLAYDISQFVEKPDRQTAQHYVDQGTYFWNTGMFMMRIDTLMNQFALYCPEIYQLLESGYDHFIENYHTLPHISIDYAVMERTHDAVLIPMLIKRSDVGSRDSMYLDGDKDAQENVVVGNDIHHTGSHNLIYSTTDKKIVVDDCHDLIVIDSTQGLYVTRRGNSQHIKKFIS